MIGELKTYSDSSKATNIKLDMAIRNFLERKGYEKYEIQSLEIENNIDIDFMKVMHISYDRNKSESDLNLIDFQQFLSAIASKSEKFVYVIESSQTGIDFYIGTKGGLNNINFLKETFEGIYSGSRTAIDNIYKYNLQKQMKYSRAMLGIPALKRDSDKEYKQSLERILFPMQGKKFRIIIVAESYNQNSIGEIISNYQTLGNEVHKLAKQSFNEQKSNSDSQGISIMHGVGSSKTKGYTETESHSYGNSDKTQDSKIFATLTTAIGAGIGFFAGGPAGSAIGAGIAGMVGNNFSASVENKNHSNSYTANNSRTNSINESQSYSKNITQTDTIGITFDEINKSAEYCEKLIDKYIERFQKGLNHGMWNASVYVQADEETVLSELEHTLKSVYSGDESYYESIRFSENLNENKYIDLSKFPMLYFDKSLKHPIHSSFTGFSSAINSEELSILAALPTNDIDGVSVSRISGFGLTQPIVKNHSKSVEIGSILNKKKITHRKFDLSMKALNSHMFVSGITGSGKSNTVKYLLSKLWTKNKTPFLVIEPAKSEYKYLQAIIPDIQIFRLGQIGDVFKFNPFVFDYQKNANYNLINHIDGIKISFSAAFPMYGPMPYILEEAIQKIYEDKGWNLTTLEHPAYDEFEGMKSEFNRMLFPSMKDLLKAIEYIVDNAGYHDELQNNIKAALVTRIKNLTIGAKGFIFNSQHAISNKHLFEKPTIIELSSIVNGEEKSFIMGLILNSLYHYIQSEGMEENLKHLIVIEEAHRLLPNISFEHNMEYANSKALSVEVFTNMLSEVRSFGEGIVIVDQVANKLHRDVIKNTNVKILHRTLAKDDRLVVGESINLNEKQILDIAELDIGEAVVHSNDVHQPFLVKVNKMEIDKDFRVNVDGFQTKFLNEYEYYKYEYPFEARYYDPEGSKFINRYKEYIFRRKNRYHILELTMQSMLGEIDKVKYHWYEFVSYNSETVQNKMHLVYSAIVLFMDMSKINDMSIYKKQYYMKDMYKRIVDIFIALSENGEIKEKIQLFQKSLIHRKIKNTYASMEFYDGDLVDYSILIHEIFKIKDEAREYMNKVLSEYSGDEKELLLIIDKLCNMAFGKVNDNLRYIIFAMRYGNKEKNLNSLLETINV